MTNVLRLNMPSLLKILPCLLVSLQIIVANGDINTNSRVVRRPPRSPQLFPGKNIVTDLTRQLKPPLIDDLDQIRQKMANLANLTSLLEQAIAAEKAARTTLQNFATTIKEQITGIKTAVNPDPKNYWLQSQECGGIMVSQTGRISYKNKEYYKDNERCVWTIRANYRSKIKITFTNGGLEDPHDYVSVTELSEKKNRYDIAWGTKRIKAGQTSIFDGPLIFITFLSDNSIRKKGFQLDFEGLGSNINTRKIYQHFHLTDWLGEFDSVNISDTLERNSIKLSDGDELQVTIVINPTYWNASKLRVSLPKDSLELRPDECDKTNLAVLNDIMTGSHGVSYLCCGASCDFRDFDTSNRAMAVVFSSKDLSEASQFQIDWSTDTNVPSLISENTCGGVLEGDIGKIRYKLDSPYDVNERCIWTIKPEKLEKAEIKIQLLKDGFEHKYDYLSVSYFPSDDMDHDMTSKFLYKSGEPYTIPASLAFIQFYSDSATFGTATGFELIWEIKYITTEEHLTSEPLQITSRREEKGDTQIFCSMRQDHIIVINPEFIEPGSLLLQRLGTLSPNQVNILGSNRGNFSKQDVSSTLDSYRSEDGPFITLTRCQAHTDTGEVVLKWEKEQLTDSNTEDVRTFIKSEDTCGELLHADSGRISYKLGKEYSMNERCTWVIQVKSLSTVTVQLMADGFESCCDKIEINRVNVENATLDSDSMTINRENRFESVEGPVVLVTFVSDHSVSGTGFELEFQTKGEKVNDSLSISSSYNFLKDTSTESYSLGQSEQSTVDVKMFHIQDGTNVTVDISNLSPNDCDKNMISVYKTGSQLKYELLKQYPDKGSCANDETHIEPVEYQGLKLSGPQGLLIISKYENENSNKNATISFS